MKYTKILPSLLLVTLSFCYCKKDKGPEPDNPYGLPNATQTGADIFACRVNGVNWISKKGIYYIGGGITKDTLFGFGSNGGANYFEDFSIRVDGFITARESYAITPGSPAKMFLITNKNCLCPDGGCSVFNSNAVSGQITITKIDSIGATNNTRIISGLFNCKIPIEDCDTLNITDGRFDIRYF